MSQTIEAVFDGLVFRPLEPVELAPYSRVQITIALSCAGFEMATVFFKQADALPPSENAGSADAAEMEDLDRYIYEHYVNSDFNRRP